MEKDKYIAQLEDIRQMMDKSSRFLSLSGLSGVLAGLFAILGALAARMVIQNSDTIYVSFGDSDFVKLIAIAFGVMLLSIIAAALLSLRKSGSRGEKLWNSVTKRVIINFSIPLLAGGLFSFSLIQNGYFELLAPVTLMFYGLALLHCSKYTFENVRYLGILFITLGLINTRFPGEGLTFWTIGFGGLHIIYGIAMYLLIERKQA